MSWAFEEDAPEVKAEALCTYVLAAEKYVQAAEAAQDVNIVRECMQNARRTLESVDRLKRSGTINILLEMQVNAAVLGMLRRLTMLSKP